MVLNYILRLVLLNALTIGIRLGCSTVYMGPLNFSVASDNWSTLFFSLLSLISSVVFIWSYYYMDSEENYVRFIIIVSLFVRSMVALIFFSRVFGAMIGWDGLGVTSFLLVIYYKNRKSLGSGIITALTNRLGDCFLLIILGICLYSSQVPEGHYIFLLFILLTSMTKRAQIPFSSWLPSAIAAPTPVSALVHSSTLVTAGIYLLIRFNPFRFEWLLPIGSATMLIAGFCACAEIDIKKIVALSTLSQLGVIIVSLSLFQKGFCFFHLITHAIFKALLFICVGVGIHTLYGSQDFRRFSGVRSSLLWPRGLLSVSNLSLLGFPFISGFYRKDLILESFYSINISLFIGLGFLIGVGSTTAYRIKIINLAVFSKSSERPSSQRSGGFRWQLKVPITILGICSITRGFFLRETLSYHLITSVIIIDKLIPLAIIILGRILGLIVRNLKAPFLRSIWNLSSLFQMTRNASKRIRACQKTDIGWVEFRGGPGSRIFFSLAIIVLHPVLRTSVILVWISLI